MASQRQPLSVYKQLSQVKLHYYDWSGTGDAIVLLHATGFHARCWDEVIKGLGSRRIIAVDTRGHGLSDKTAPPFQWAQFGDDIVELLDTLALSRVTIVGHSMGGYLALYAAARRPELIRQVLSIDPVVMSPERLQQLQKFADSGIPHPAARRRNEWVSAEEMLQSFKQREPFNLWHAQVLQDYCNYGLVAKSSTGAANRQLLQKPKPDDSAPSQPISNEQFGFQLACPPEVEAAIYKSSGGELLFDMIERLPVPVRILRARQREPEDSPFDFRPSPTWPGLVGCMPNASELYLPTLTHFIPMEDPELVAQEILAIA